MKKIKLALFDVDGVMTDGSLYYGVNGQEQKVFHAHDGVGFVMLLSAGVRIRIITGGD